MAVGDRIRVATKASVDNVQAQIDQLVVNGDSSPAAAQAQVGADGTVHGSLKTRLDVEHNEVSRQLAQITNQFQNIVDGEIQEVLNDEIVHTEIEQKLLSKEIEYAPSLSALKLNSSLPHFNETLGEYVGLGNFWNALRNGKIYTTEFNQYDISPLSSGTKLHDNAGLVMEPSTNSYRGRDDYSKIGLFMPIEVNAYIDENDDYHVIAIEGDGRFKRDGTNGDVWVMSMPGYLKYYSNDTTWGVSYSDVMHPGFEILQEAVKPDGTIRPYLLHAKYAAGRNPHENNNLASISGVYPEYNGMSHNGQITEFGKKGSQYSGKTSHDDFYVQLMMWLKYATLNSQTIMKGCEQYSVQYINLLAESDVKRVIITNTQASNLLIGSTVSIGDYGTGSINADRQSTQNYNLANRVSILDIVDLGDGNSAVYVDAPSAFNTSLTTTITTYPWNTGGCDSVLGTDGSPYSNTSGKEPFIINGIEMCIGGYEVLQNLIILNNATDNRIDVYANYDCVTYATSITGSYDLVGQLAQTNNTWMYGSKLSIPKNHPSVILITDTKASSTTGTGDGIYTNPPSTGGSRVWRSLGGLHDRMPCGLRCLTATAPLYSSYWALFGRLSATGRSRRRAGVN